MHFNKLLPMQAVRLKRNVAPGFFLWTTWYATRASFCPGQKR